MNVDGDKIKSLIADYGKSKGYLEKSYVAMFCEENALSYNQWNAYTRGAQNIGTKVIHRLIEIFPDLNLNWLLKDAPNKYIGEGKELILCEPVEKYDKNVTNEDLMNKLESILSEVKKISKQE
jgi:hypothetical protein